MRSPVIAGIGVVSSIGIGLNAYWDSLQRGASGIGNISLFDTSGFAGRLGAEVRDFPDVDFKSLFSLFPGAHDLRPGRISRCESFGLLAAFEAIRDSGLDFSSIDPERVAVVLGGGAGGLLSTERFKRLIREGKKARPSMLMPFCASALTDLLASVIGSRGYRTTISTACSSSNTAVGMAAELIEDGIADIAITGGAESLSETTFAGFNSLRAVDEVPCRPFDLERKGISLGEGSAIFVLAKDSAGLKKRYARIGGYALSADAHHVTAPAPDGQCIAMAIANAIKYASVSAGDIGYVNAHGTATKANDSAEANALKRAFGKRASAIPVSSTKSMIGHCLGAAGAMETAASVMALYRGMLPPTLNYLTPDPECDLDVIPNKSRKADVMAVLSNSLAFGGNNTALVLLKA